jgi:hypothetical protein
MPIQLNYSLAATGSTADTLDVWSLAPDDFSVGVHIIHIELVDSLVVKQQEFQKVVKSITYRVEVKHIVTDEIRDFIDTMVFDPDMIRSDSFVEYDQIALSTAKRWILATTINKCNDLQTQFAQDINRREEEAARQSRIVIPNWTD